MSQNWQLPADSPHPGDHVDVWRIDLVPSGQVLGRVRSWLAADEVERAGRFRFERDRVRYEIGRGALRDIIGRYLRLDPKAVVLTYSDQRKPHLREPAPLHFNLSNSHDLAVLAVSRRGPVGVDLEYIGRQIDDLLELAETVFSAEEQASLRAFPPAGRHAAFLRGWTRKEAYLKGIGKGLMVPLKDFTVSLQAKKRPKITLPGWHLLDFDPGRDYYGALATPFRVEQVHFFEWQR